MTDEAYHAKEWLEVLDDLYYQAKKTERAVEEIASRINSAVSSYESIGSGRADLIVRQQQHEDRLLDYSMKREQYDREYFAFVKMELVAFRLFDRMKSGLHAGLLMNRHITHMKWSEIEKLYKDRYKKRSLIRHYHLALEEFYPLIQTEEPVAIQEVEQVIKDFKNRATA